MTRLAPAARRRQPGAGHPRLPGPAGDQGRRRAAPSRPTSTSTPITWGAPRAPPGDRRASSRAGYRRWPSIPSARSRVTCGSTEAMIADAARLVDPGDEVIVFEPFYENYGPDAILSGAAAALRPAARARTGRSTPTSCAAAFNDRTAAIIVNTPNNPTGKVFTRDELEHDRRALPQVGRASRSPTRSTSTSSTTAREHVAAGGARRACASAR